MTTLDQLLESVAALAQQARQESGGQQWDTIDSIVEDARRAIAIVEADKSWQTE